MPTAAKLIAGIYFAALAVLAAQLYIPGLPEGKNLGYFREFAALVGLICGWLVMGRLVGKRYYDALGSGVRTSIAIVFWVLLFFSIYEMLRLSTKLNYDGPMEALIGGMGLMLEYARLLGTPAVLGTLILGGMLGGVLAEWGGRRWK